MDVSAERKLLARAQTSADGFAELFDEFYDRIYTYAYRRVGTRTAAEDIAACVFEDALRGIKRMRWQGRPIAAWLYRIAARRVADHYRDKENWVGAEIESAVDASQNPAGLVERSERHAAVRAGLARLEPRDREVITLVYFDEVEAKEIAAMWNTSPNNIYVRLHRALKKLRAVLDEVENEMG